MNKSRPYNKNRGGFRRNRGGNSNFKPTNRQFANGNPHEQLKEEDVGITEYLSDLEGFTGVLKARYSDFHVNEINKDREIAKFTSTEIPVSSDQIKSDFVMPKESPCEYISQEHWDEIASIDETKIVKIDITGFDKEKRGIIHKCVKEHYKQKVVASTVEHEGVKYIEIKQFNSKNKLDHRSEWTKGEYVHFILYKENIDTLEAIMKISSCLNMKPAAFSYAGVKDRRAKTTQWVCVRRVDPWKLFKKTKCLRNVFVGNVTFKDYALKLGGLWGNRFRIAIRNITVDDELITKSMDKLKETGFINYYGLQRFGHNKEVPTYEIGIKLLLGQFKEACDLILKPKKYDDPNSDITKAKIIYNTTQDVAKACEAFSENENTCPEHKLLIGMSKCNKNDYVTALETIPRNMRLLYLHAFQALIWNKMVSVRIKEFGMKPIVGDLVYCDEVDASIDAKTDIDVNKDDVEKLENVEVPPEINEDKNENVEEANVEETTRQKRNVKILSESDLDKYTIYDVVLPLPGSGTIYPNNKLKDYYKEILESYGLSLDMSIHNVKTYCLSGAYRKLLRPVIDLSWKVMRYNQPQEELIRSDFGEYTKQKEPEDSPNGAYKALILEFSLKSSSYATMVIREILKTDTSTTSHAKLNDYHQSTNKSENTNSGNLSIDGPTPYSLLSDPAKYEEFKRSIFGESKRKPEEDVNEENNKKVKTDDE